MNCATVITIQPFPFCCEPFGDKLSIFPWCFLFTYWHFCMTVFQSIFMISKLSNNGSSVILDVNLDTDVLVVVFLIVVSSGGKSDKTKGSHTEGLPCICTLHFSLTSLINHFAQKTNTRHDV